MTNIVIIGLYFTVDKQNCSRKYLRKFVGLKKSVLEDFLDSEMPNKTVN
jgi:hypothetical protein